MAQNAKFIDVTRTYLPVDPNSFPESLHGATREDSPEAKIPVMAYKGYNFLPTGYGYKSYFGVGKTINIDAITAKVDHIFIFQNLGYENILIALTETGVWTKKGETAGAWINNVPIVAPTDPAVHYGWSFCIIANILYAYMAGKPSYVKFVHSSVAQLVISTVVPAFLNMAAQVGIFRAAGRLAFWDTDDSIGWANLDDFADFTPSLETLAGNAKFASIQGRITTIQAHGIGFIIYATKSIIYVSQNIENVFQWKPAVILQTAGIAYPRQMVAASPDTLHFAYTSEGLKRIENAKEETIVPEVTDFLKDYSRPVYLRVLEGRYLFLEILDSGYITGRIQLTDEVVPAATYVFEGSTVPMEDEVLTDSNVCDVMGKISSGAYPGTLPTPKPANQSLTDTRMKPQWTCYISQNGVTDPANIVWGAIPCATVDPNLVEVNMNPSGITTGMLTQTSAGKKVVTGAQAYIDGWTMERFVAVQTGIWEREAQAIKAYITAITNRAKTGAKTLPVPACVASPMAGVDCTSGRYISEFSAPQFGYSLCSYWLTRMATAAIDLVRRKANVITCEDKRVSAPLIGYALNWQTGSAIYGSAQAAKDAAAPSGPTLSDPVSYGTTEGSYWTGDVVTFSKAAYYFSYLAGGGQIIFAVYRGTAAYTIYDLNPHVGGNPPPFSAHNTVMEPTAGRYGQTDTMYAYNRGVDVADFAPILETAYCEITGWEYTTTTGAKAVVAATVPCTAPTIFPKNNNTTRPGGRRPPVATKTGDICGLPYEPITIDGTPIDWPTETVTIPSGSFLLQLGSPAPKYATYEGALVYDLQLKKWGKMLLRYKQLLDYSPINSTLNGVVPTNIFGIMAGALGANGKISIFDAFPAASYISYGKIGYYRGGNTRPEQATVHFRTASTGFIKIETSLEGRDLSARWTVQQAYTNATEATVYGGFPGRWCNIEINGIYDINYLEFRGFIQGRR